MNDMEPARPDVEMLHALGFENMREYKMYLEIKKSLRQQVRPGIAS